MVVRDAQNQLFAFCYFKGNEVWKGDVFKRWLCVDHTLAQNRSYVCVHAIGKIQLRGYTDLCIVPKKVVLEG